MKIFIRGLKWINFLFEENSPKKKDLCENIVRKSFLKTITLYSNFFRFKNSANGINSSLRWIVVFSSQRFYFSFLSGEILDQRLPFKNQSIFLDFFETYFFRNIFFEQGICSESSYFLCLSGFSVFFLQAKKYLLFLFSFCN